MDKYLEIQGVKDGVTSSIDADQIALDGVCVYDKYILIFINSGTRKELTKEEMQTFVDMW